MKPKRPDWVNKPNPPLQRISSPVCEVLCLTNVSGLRPLQAPGSDPLAAPAGIHHALSVSRLLLRSRGIFLCFLMLGHLGNNRSRLLPQKSMVRICRCLLPRGEVSNYCITFCTVSYHSTDEPVERLTFSLIIPIHCWRLTP